MPSDFERLRAALSEIPVQQLSQTAQRALDAVERLATDLYTRVGPLIDAAQGTAGGATHTLDIAAQAIAQLQADASRTLADIDKLAIEAQQQVDERGPELARLLATADRAGRAAEKLLGSIDNLTSPRGQLRSDLEATVRDLAASASSLRGFTQTIERDPSAILRGRR
ncbi:MAG: hypothetical protein JO227_00525 [Acetobacteraceae bacterium]|nr:hypothetical protein [Acetobacteraceae bacterium]